MTSPIDIVKIIPPEAHSREQTIIMNALRTEGLRNVFVSMGTKFGKAADVNEMVPTPDGWRKMGDLKTGDYVFDDTGSPTRIKMAWPVMIGRPCYRVHFSDGASVVVDAEHLWTTTTHAERKNYARSKKEAWKNKVRTTEEIKDTLGVTIGGIWRANHAVDNLSGPAMFTEKKLPIHPYILGAWLGDGSSSCGQITKPLESFYARLQESGARLGKLISGQTRNVEGLTTLIKKHGLYKNKHVPSEYLEASPQQRLQLLQGLMDTDGTISKNGIVCFDNTNKNVADAVESLLLSFGVKVNRTERYGKLNGQQKNLCYRVQCTTDVPVFSIPEKANRLRPIATKAKRRLITKIETVETRPVRCITVEAASSLYLISRWFIPTHNTIASAVAVASPCLERPGTIWRWVAPIYQQAKIGLEYCQKIMPPEPDVRPNLSLMHLYAPDVDSRIEFWHGQHPMSLEGAGVHGYVIDEAAKCQEQVYISAKTTVTMTKGPIMAISTPLGKNWFYQRAMEAKEHMTWAIKTGRPLEQIFLAAPTAANPYISRDIIDRARRELPDRLFRQYYLAEFLDEGTVFAGINDALYGPPLDFPSDAAKWITPDAKDRTVVIGADWAKTEDYTVFTAIDVQTRELCGFYRFHKVPYTEAVRRLIWFATRFQSVLVIRHDRTGVGSAIEDLLSHTDLPHEGVTWTNTVKNEMVAKLITGFEQAQIKIPRWGHLIQELEQYEVHVTPSGTMTYGAPAGKHDDCVSSLMMAYAACVEYGDRDLEVRYVNEIGESMAPKDGLEAYYRDLVEDDED